MKDEPKTECRTPTRGRDGVTRIPTWKYDAVRMGILTVLEQSGAEGFAFADLPQAVDALLASDTRKRLGSVGWHVTTVKLNMEATGEIQRLLGKAPQRLVLA